VCGGGRHAVMDTRTAVIQVPGSSSGVSAEQAGRDCRNLPEIEQCPQTGYS
jgi:hypothetical protein